MRLLSAEGIREADRRAIEDLGIPGALLMENAGMRLTEGILSLDPLPRKVLVLAGPGNNGGDGLVVARHLDAFARRTGIDMEVKVWCTASQEKYRGDARTNLELLLHRDFTIHYYLEEEDLESLEPHLREADLVVDALLGTGTSRPVEGRLARLIPRINQEGSPVLSVDIPSGIHANTGKVLGTAVQAHWTITFAYPKRGLMVFPGAGYAGRVLVGEIYIPEKEAPDEGVEVITPGRVKEILPGRPLDAHKGTFGKVLVVAGSPGMTGAAVLASESALRGGAGLVYLATASGLRPLLENKLVEVITLDLPGDQKNREHIPPQAVDRILSLAEDCQVLAVGPGLPPDENTFQLLQNLLPASPVPVVLDAGALTALSREPGILRRAAAPVIITPHPGEASRLLHVDAEEVTGHRLDIPAQMARDWGVVAVLKGAPTVVSSPQGKTWVNSTGGPALATAGSGDLLTGIISAWLAQEVTVEEAAVGGVFLHGLAGDIASRQGRGLKAGDILLSFPAALSAVEHDRWESSPFGPFNRPVFPAVARR